MSDEPRASSLSASRSEPGSTPPAMQPPGDGVEWLLAAGANEATRIATALGRLDQKIGTLMLAAREPGVGIPSAGLGRALQDIDLIRQEAEGLSRLLLLLARSGANGTPVNDAVIATALSLADQRERLAANTDAQRRPA